MKRRSLDWILHLKMSGIKSSRRSREQGPLQKVWEGRLGVCKPCAVSTNLQNIIGWCMIDIKIRRWWGRLLCTDIVTHDQFDPVWSLKTIFHTIHQFGFQNLDQCQYLNNCTPPLTQQQATHNKIGLMWGEGRGRCAIAHLLTLIPKSFVELWGSLRTLPHLKMEKCRSSWCHVNKL